MQDEGVHLRWNQDATCLAVASRHGVRVLDESGVVCFEEAIGAVRHAELLFSTSLLAVVGAGDTPALSPRRLCILSTATRAPIAEVLCAAPVVAVRLSRERLVLLLERRAIAHDLATLNIVDEVDTAPNAAGLCALASSASRERPYLAVPAQSAPGAVTVRSLGATPSTVCEVAAHSSAIAALALTPDGTLLATASVKGTVIRVHSLPRATPLCSLRRGARPARVFCLAFSAASGGAPPLLAASCDSGTVHLFQLSPAAARGAAAAAAVAVVASLVPRSLQPALRGAAAPRAAVAVKLPSRGVRTEVAVRPLLAPDSDAQSADSARLLVASCDGILQEYHITGLLTGAGTATLERECSIAAQPAREGGGAARWLHAGGGDGADQRAEEAATCAGDALQAGVAAVTVGASTEKTAWCAQLTGAFSEHAAGASEHDGIGSDVLGPA